MVKQIKWILQNWCEDIPLNHNSDNTGHGRDGRTTEWGLRASQCKKTTTLRAQGLAPSLRANELLPPDSPSGIAAARQVHKLTNKRRRRRAAQEGNHVFLTTGPKWNTWGAGAIVCAVSIFVLFLSWCLPWHFSFGLAEARVYVQAGWMKLEPPFLQFLSTVGQRRWLHEKHAETLHCRLADAFIESDLH